MKNKHQYVSEMFVLPPACALVSLSRHAMIDDDTDVGFALSCSESVRTSTKRRVGGEKEREREKRKERDLSTI